MKSIAIGSVIALALQGSAALAAPPVTQNATVSQLDALQSQIAVLKAELQVAKLKAGIKAAREPDVRNGARGVSGGDPAAAVSGSDANAKLPRVASISGRGHRLAAELLMPGGGEVIVSAGEGLPGGLVVHDITPNGVRVMQAGDLLPLPFVDNSGQSVAPQSGRMVALPPPPVFSGAPGVPVGLPGR